MALPFSAAAGGGVVINEVGWSGTKASSADEWIEFYNITDSAVDLANFKVSFFKPATTTSSKDVVLSGIIPAKGFYLIERTDDMTISDIVADLISSFGSGLVDTGMILKLSEGGIVVDSTSELCDNKWCAGSANQEISMERIDPIKDGSLASNWASNNGVKINGHDAAGNPIHGTPKSENSVFGSSESSAQNSGNASLEEQQSSSVLNESQSTSIISASPAPKEVMKAYAGEDKVVLAGQETAFLAKATDLSGKVLDSNVIRFLWNFGDGAIKDGKVISHTYLFPGKYTASVNAVMLENSASDYLNVEVLVPKISISEVKPGVAGFIELTNETGRLLDIGGLVLKDNSARVFSVPLSTFLAANSVIVFPNAVTLLLAAGLADIKLITSNGYVVDEAYFEKGIEVAAGESLIQEGEKFIKTSSTSPGFLNPKMSLAGVVAAVSPGTQKSSAGAPVGEKITENKKTAGGGAGDTGDKKGTEATAVIVSISSLVEQNNNIKPLVSGSDERLMAVSGPGFFSGPKIFLAASVVIGLAAAAGFLLFRGL